MSEEIARLKRELAARAIRTMGPRSPFWNCTVCGAAHLTPIMFKHKPDCLLADAPLPSALWPDGYGGWSLICTAPLLLAALKEAVEFQAEDTECLMGRDPQPGDDCVDGRCKAHGCMVTRINRWREAIVKAEERP